MSHDARVSALDALLEDAGLDAVLATKDASIAYFTGFWGMQLERFFGVAIRRGGDGALIAPTLDRDSVSGAPTGLEKTLYDAAQIERARRAVRDARRRQADRRRGGPPQLRPLPRARRRRVRTGPRHRRDHAPARRQGRGGGRGRPPRLRAHRGRLRGAVGGPAAGRDRGRGQRPRRLQPRAPRRDGHRSRTSSSAPTRPRRTASPTSATLQPGDVVVADICGAVRRLLGRPHPLRARRAAERLGEPRLGGRARGLRRRRSPPRASAPRAATSTPPSARSSRPIRSSAPACTAPATRSAPRSTSRRS